jgi:sterol 3beta-glucosyltransferase
LGVGTSVKKLTVSNLSDALNAATTDYKQISRAKFIGEQIRGVSISLRYCRCCNSTFIQEDGVTIAIESIYRDLEYARSLIKHHGVDDLEGISEVDGEDSTIRNHDDMSPSSLSGYSSSGSLRGAPSEDWSVISEQDERQSSAGSRGQAAKKRTSLVSPGSPILPDSTTEPPSSRSLC